MHIFNNRYYCYYIILSCFVNIPNKYTYIILSYNAANKSRPPVDSARQYPRIARKFHETKDKRSARALRQTARMSMLRQLNLVWCRAVLLRSYFPLVLPVRLANVKVLAEVRRADLFPQSLNNRSPFFREDLPAYLGAMSRSFVVVFVVVSTVVVCKVLRSTS